MRVQALGEADATLMAVPNLPLPGKLSEGARLDDFLIEAELHSGRTTRLYRARHVTTGQLWVIKTLQSVLQGDTDAASRFLAEEWFLKRVRSHYFPEVLPHIQSGKLRALAVADDKRLAQLPEVPTFAEQGFPGFLVYSWYGCVAPAGTPDPVVRKLHAAFAQALSAPDMIERLTKQGMVILNSPPEELRRFMQAEQARYAEPVRLSGAKID